MRNLRCTERRQDMKVSVIFLFFPACSENSTRNIWACGSYEIKECCTYLNWYLLQGMVLFYLFYSLIANNQWKEKNDLERDNNFQENNNFHLFSSSAFYSHSWCQSILFSEMFFFSWNRLLWLTGLPLKWIVSSTPGDFFLICELYSYLHLKND